MSEKKPASERTFPRQIKMTDAFHERAVEAATKNHKTFSEYVRDLITADLERKGKR